jgi:WD40 repeat protein
VDPDGGWVLTAGADETGRVWDVATGGQQLVLMGHRGGVRGGAGRQMGAHGRR